MKAIIRKIEPDTTVEEYIHEDTYTALMFEMAGEIIEVTRMDDTDGWYVQGPHDNWMYETNWHHSWLVMLPDENELLEIAKDMYAEIETRATEHERGSGWEMSEDMQNDLDKWFEVIHRYDPMYLVPLDECVPTEDR